MSQPTLTKQDLFQLFNNSNDAGKQLLQDKFGKQTFENPLDSFEDCCAFNGTTPEEVIPFKNPKNEDEKSVNAYAMLIQIYRAYNNGKKPDWKNSSQRKWRNWYWMDGRNASGSGLSLGDVDGDDSDANVASRLHTLEESHAEQIYKKFPQIVEDFMIERD